MSIIIINIFADHKYNENLTHTQTTSTRPSCLPITVTKAKTWPGIEATIYIQPGVSEEEYSTVAVVV